jgi:acetyl-CoA carboxylase carboxyl transferase subunit alpha
VIDEILPEPPGGAHRDPRAMATTLKNSITRQLRQLTPRNIRELLDQRYAKYRKMGVFI